LLIRSASEDGISGTGFVGISFGHATEHETGVRVYLTGVSCVGKTAIGRELASLRSTPFFDLDAEVESYFGVSIERLQNRFLTVHSFRNEAAKALSALLSRPASTSAVIALPPSGLMGGYWRVVKLSPGMTVALTDTPENILARIAFYDVDSKPIEKELTDEEKRWYLRDIQKDITYFGKTYKRADYRVYIAGLDAFAAAQKIQNVVLAAGEERE
jgi:shikimate kinase